tara:strand:- start:3102 stop:4448 length:1347 start_codon:yes stop_codon:yes gene_type:complete
MDKLDLNEILNRKIIENQIIDIINNFYSEDNKNTCNKNKYKSGIYIYGDSGIGKTSFIYNIIKNLNYDVIYYDNTIVRNKQLIDSISSLNMSNNNVLSLFKKKIKIVVVLDEIDGINIGDKAAINSLIKLLRIKKTKKQQLENITSCPVICINNNQNDKKINELINVCNSFKLNTPSNGEILNILKLIMPNIFNDKINIYSLSIFQKNILNYIDNNLNKLQNIIKFYNHNILYKKFINNFETNEILNESNIKYITQNILENYYGFSKHELLNDTNRTTVSLLLHENVVSLLDNLDTKNKINIYYKLLENFKFSDYIDRIIFQKQIWQLNDINYIIKIFYNNYILNTYNLLNKININNIIFTKILTKYSNEYNNLIFYNNICYSLLIDKKDVILLFTYLKYKIENKETDIDIIVKLLESYNIFKLDFIRIIKYIDYINNNNINNNNYLS